MKTATNPSGGEEQPNRLCRRCVRTCRQSRDVLLIDCPRFLKRPFKIEEPRYKQLDLFGK